MGLAPNLKRLREVGDDEASLAGSEPKRPFVEDTAPLEEVLSDISDDADEILNRDDGVSQFCWLKLFQCAG